MLIFTVYSHNYFYYQFKHSLQRGITAFLDQNDLSICRFLKFREALLGTG